MKPHSEVLRRGKFGTTSGHLESENLVDRLCKRHHTKLLVFCPTCFASRGSPVRSRSRPPIFFISSIELAVVVRWVADQREARRAQFCALPALPSPRSRHLRRDERKITKDLFAAGARNREAS